MPIPDKIAAANKINDFLRGVVTHGGLRLKYRITVDPPLPDERDWERPEILVEFAGPDSHAAAGARRRIAARRSSCWPWRCFASPATSTRRSVSIA